MEDIPQNVHTCKGCSDDINIKQPEPHNMVIRLQGDTGYVNPKTNEYVRKFSNIYFHTVWVVIHRWNVSFDWNYGFYIFGSCFTGGSASKESILTWNQRTSPALTWPSSSWPRHTWRSWKEKTCWRPWFPRRNSTVSFGISFLNCRFALSYCRTCRFTVHYLADSCVITFSLQIQTSRKKKVRAYFSWCYPFIVEKLQNFEMVVPKAKGVDGTSCCDVQVRCTKHVYQRTKQSGVKYCIKVKTAANLTM